MYTQNLSEEQFGVNFISRTSRLSNSSGPLWAEDPRTASRIQRIFNLTTWYSFINFLHFNLIPFFISRNRKISDEIFWSDSTGCFSMAVFSLWKMRERFEVLNFELFELKLLCSPIAVFCYERLPLIDSSKKGLGARAHHVLQEDWEQPTGWWMAKR